jgi:hypothetical protein
MPRDQTLLSSRHGFSCFLFSSSCFLWGFLLLLFFSLRRMQNHKLLLWPSGQRAKPASRFMWRLAADVDGLTTVSSKHLLHIFFFVLTYAHAR